MKDRAQGAALILGAVAALLLTANLVMLPVPVPRSPNEGWNAFHALHALAGAGLYPGARTLLFNNYPPLSYFLTAPLGLMLGDQIIAGRLISLLATLGVALALFRAARLLGCSAAQSWVAAMLFLASPWVLTKIGGIDDPQLLGNFLDALGLVVLLRRPSDLAHVVLAAALFSAAMFIKLLFLDMPLAVFLWLAMTERRSAAILAASCAVFGVAGLVASDALLHVDLLPHVLSARVFLPGQMLAHPGQWLVTGALPLIASLSLLRIRNDKGALLAGLYALAAVPLTLFFSGGEGVSAGPTFDLSMAVALGSAVFLSRRPGFAIATFAAAGLTAVVGVASFFGLWSSSPSSFAVLAARPQVHADIERVADAHGPVLCEMLALCYWAGRDAEVDAFGLSEAFKRHTRDESELTGKLDAHYFALVQLTPRSSFAYSPGILAALARDYRLEHRDGQGSFYLPRIGK